MAELEAAALSGALFRGPRTPSPTRSDSTVSPINTDDELGSDLDVDDDDPKSKTNRINPNIHQIAQPSINPLIPSHTGPQTGPKGVQADRLASERYKATQREAEVKAILADQARRAMVVPTSDEDSEMRKREEERRKKGEIDDEEIRARWRRERREELAREGEGEGVGGLGRGDRGGLREVGKEGFVLAVERRGWVVVLVYEPHIPRCKDLLLQTLHLSLNLPKNLSTPINILRARATSLQFSLLPSTGPSSSAPRRGTEVGDPGDDGNDEGDGHGEEGGEGIPDPDVLPTLLVYRDGELYKSYVRVDWDIKEDGLGGLLTREGVLPPSTQLSFGRSTPREDGDEDDD